MDTTGVVFSFPSTSDWISITDIIVTAGIGIWIGVTVQRNFAISRSVKDYFILESQEIREQYRIFLNDLFQHKSSSKNIKEWFKVMTLKISVFEDFLKCELRVNPEVLIVHNRFKQFLTETEEFNDQYGADTFKITNNIKQSVLEIHREYLCALASIVIDINKSRRQRRRKKSRK